MIPPHVCGNIARRNQEEAPPPALWVEQNEAVNEILGPKAFVSHVHHPRIARSEDSVPVDTFLRGLHLELEHPPGASIQDQDVDLFGAAQSVRAVKMPQGQFAEHQELAGKAKVVAGPLEDLASAIAFPLRLLPSAHELDVHNVDMPMNKHSVRGSPKGARGIPSPAQAGCRTLAG